MNRKEEYFFRSTLKLNNPYCILLFKLIKIKNYDLDNFLRVYCILKYGYDPIKHTHYFEYDKSYYDYDYILVNVLNNEREWVCDYKVSFKDIFYYIVLHIQQIKWEYDIRPRLRKMKSFYSKKEQKLIDIGQTRLF